MGGGSGGGGEAVSHTDREESTTRQGVYSFLISRHITAFFCDINGKPSVLQSKLTADVCLLRTPLRQLSGEPFDRK